MGGFVGQQLVRVRAETLNSRRLLGSSHTVQSEDGAGESARGVIFWSDFRTSLDLLLSYRAKGRRTESDQGQPGISVKPTASIVGR